MAAATALVCRAMAAEIPAPDQLFYQNVDLEFSARLLPHFPACVSDETNHGVVILLDRLTRCDEDYETSRAIFVYANSNTAVEAATPAGLARIECRWRGARHITWLKGQISGRTAAGCRRDFPDGHIEVSLRVLRKTEPWRARWIEVGADLVTTPQHYRADLRLYRRILRGIRVHPDGPLR